MKNTLFPSLRMLGALGLAGLMALGLGAGAQAQTWPERPVTIIVPFPAGGNTDTMARLLAERLQRKLGQGFVIDNRPAGGGIVATGQVARSKPDGYTLLFASAGQNIILPMLVKVTYDPVKDLAPISIFGAGAFILGAKKETPFNTMAELIVYAKANPGKLNVASAGNGSIGHLSAALFAKRASIDMVTVPYKGGGASVAAVVAGESHWTFTPAAAVMSLIRANRLRALGHSLLKRTPLLGDMPAIAETLPGFTYSGWYGINAPKNTPKPIIDKIRNTLIKVAASPEFKELISAQAAEVVINTPDEFRKFVQEDIAVTGKAVRAAGLKSE